MPCWTVRETTVDLDASTMNHERLLSLADRLSAEYRINLAVVDGRVTLSSYSLNETTMRNTVAREYAKATVVEAQRRFGFRVKQESTVAGKTVLRMGR
jgi:hypothetical protein